MASDAYRKDVEVREASREAEKVAAMKEVDGLSKAVERFIRKNKIEFEF